MNENINAKDSVKDAPDVNEVKRETREKILSKMEVTKFFAGFISLLIGILLQEARMNSGRSKVGVIFFLFSLGFCVAAISAYDHLLSPRKYLVEKYWRDLTNKGDWEFQEKLYSQLICSWRWLFVPALVFFGVGFAFLLMQELGPQLLRENPGDRTYFGLFILLALIFGGPTAVLFAKWGFERWRGKPKPRE